LQEIKVLYTDGELSWSDYFKALFGTMLRCLLDVMHGIANVAKTLLRGHPEKGTLCAAPWSACMYVLVLIVYLKAFSPQLKQTGIKKRV
jgi:hypothetical protein